jgi:hypothetical protein
MPMQDRIGDVTLITPPEMLTRQGVPAWHVVFEEWNQTGKRFSHNWWHVVSAEPYSKPAAK